MIIDRKDIIEAWKFLRRNDTTIPNETLDFIKEQSLKAFDNIKKGHKMENGLDREAEQYYIQDVSRGYVGNSVLWWKHDDCGYVCDIRLARVWNKEDAEEQCKASDELRMWNKKYIDVRVQHHIDMQTIDARDIHSGAKQYSYPNTNPTIKKR